MKIIFTIKVLDNDMQSKLRFFFVKPIAIFIALYLVLPSIGFAQKVDSTSIAIFFSPQNLLNVNRQTKDSIYKLTGKNEVLRDLYYYHDARLNLQTGQLDEAMNICLLRLENIPENLPEFTKAKYYNIIGSVHANNQEIKRAILYFEKALRFSEEADQDIYASMMESNIANMYFSLVDYDSAYKHISKGYKVMKKYPEHPFHSNLVAILSISEAKVGKMTEAKKHGLIALKSAEENGGTIAIIVSKLALGEVANSEGKYVEAKVHLTNSLELSERYQQKPFIILNSIGLMVANLGLKQYSEAVEYGEKALNLTKEGGDQSTTYSIKKNLAAAYAGTNQPVKAYEMLSESHAVFREVNSIENKKSINNILLKYDSEKKQKELIASKNELLQKKMERNNLTITLAFFVLISIVLVFTIRNIKNRNKSRILIIQNEQENKINQAIIESEEFERERIANELHDGVASRLTAVRYQLMANERIPQADKTQLGEILLQAHEDTRRLSHNLSPISIEKLGFEKALIQFAEENSTEKSAVIASITPSGKLIPPDKATILYRVAQELTQNAMKHALASEISIQVFVNDKITLIVEDDGKGFDFEQKKDSNGLLTIAKRANQLNGTFLIDSSINCGTTATFILK